MNEPNTNKVAPFIVLGLCVLAGIGTYFFLAGSHLPEAPLPTVVSVVQPAAPVPTAPTPPPPVHRQTLASTPDFPKVPDAQGNWIANGGFEMPLVTNSYFATFRAGQSLPGHWVVYMGDVEVTSTECCPAASGAQSLDLDGTMTGAVYQDVFRVAGKKFLLRFALGGNLRGGPPVKRMRVTWGNYRGSQIIAELECDPSQSPNWKTYSYEIAATGDYDRLTFQSLTPGNNGPMLDDVSLTEMVGAPAATASLSER